MFYKCVNVTIEHLLLISIDVNFLWTIQIFDATSWQFIYSQSAMQENQHTYYLYWIVGFWCFVLFYNLFGILKKSKAVKENTFECKICFCFVCFALFLSFFFCLFLFWLLMFLNNAYILVCFSATVTKTDQKQISEQRD